MRKSFSRLVALITLSQVCVLYGGGFLLAYQEQPSPSKTECARACCRLAKAGSHFAASCCALRGESPADPAPEPVRAKQLAPLGLPAIDSQPTCPDAQGAWASLRRSSSLPAESPNGDLYLRHSILRV
jgi:hypothetical protein